jgi:hypothetical protein
VFSSFSFLFLFFGGLSSYIYGMGDLGREFIALKGILCPGYWYSIQCALSFIFHFEVVGRVYDILHQSFRKGIPACLQGVIHVLKQSSIEGEMHLWNDSINLAL